MQSPERLLVIRLDRIGDVVLSTPVLGVLRVRYPSAHIAMLVREPLRELLEGHPHLNDVLGYDKDGRHRSASATTAFAWGLRRHRFDTALILHPSNRSHWIPWLAGIPQRIGYDWKAAPLLTHRIRHIKQEGQRHEADYTLDTLRMFGIAPPAPAPLLAVLPARRAWIEQWLTGQGIIPNTPLVALHPGASDPVKRWPAERFGQLADRLAKAHGLPLVIIGGIESVPLGRAVAGAMRAGQAVDACGALSVGQLAALLARCRALISNDSGPVHVAAAVGTPVISLFGRNDPGLGPIRWGPVGPGHIALHTDRGGRLCQDARCPQPFEALEALSVDDVAGVFDGLRARW